MKFGLRELVFMLILMAIPLAAWRMVFRPHSLREKQMLEQIEAKQAKLRDLSDTTRAIGNIKQETLDLEKGIILLQSRLPSEKEVSKVLEDVTKLAEANQLVAKSFRSVDKLSEPAYAQANGQQAEQPIVLKLEGNFRGFYSFMLAMENQNRLMRIRKMTLTKPEKVEEGIIQATFEMTIFFERSKEKA